jgi:hypothetical protein
MLRRFTKVVMPNRIQAPLEFKKGIPALQSQALQWQVL